MDAALQTQLTVAAFACSVAALFFSLLAAFPGLKAVLAAVRDGVLWFALFLVLGGIAFVVWQRLEAERGQEQVAQRTAELALSASARASPTQHAGWDQRAASPGPPSANPQQ